MKWCLYRKSIVTISAAVIAFLALTSQSVAQSAEEFFKGKTIRFMHVTGPGGTMDLYALMIIKHMQKYLPEGTNVVLEHRPGAGGIVGTNYLYSSAPKDGTYFGLLTGSFVVLTFTRPEQARYDPEKFIPLGRLVGIPRVFVARSDSGIKSMADATKVAAAHATMPPGTSAHVAASAANEVMGTKFKIVPGYAGGGAMFVALEQGEVQVTTAEPAHLIANKWHLVKDGTINLLAVAADEPVEGLEQVPLWTDFAPKDHPLIGVLEAASLSQSMGMSLFLPPEVPEDRAAYLRNVLNKTMADPELIAEAKQRNIPLDWRGPDWISEQVKRTLAQPEQVREWYAKLPGQK